MTKSRILRAFANQEHAHEVCVEEALAMAERTCSQSGQRLTKLRRRILELVWSSHKPVKAYELMDLLRSDEQRAAPPTVYRALDFLIEVGLVHRIDSLNAFVGCGEPSTHHSSQFLICRKCGTVAEIHDKELVNQMIHSAKTIGFVVEKEVLECIGLCQYCATTITQSTPTREQ